jgi:hypothetical protein
MKELEICQKCKGCQDCMATKNLEWSYKEIKQLQAELKVTTDALKKISEKCVLICGKVKNIANKALQQLKDGE